MEYVHFMLLQSMDLKNRIPDIILYFFVGGIAALTDLFIFYVFANQLGFNYLLITIIGFVVATFVNYLLSIKFVFHTGARYARGAEIIITYMVSAIGLIVHISVLFLLIDFLQFEKMLSKIIAIVSAFMFNFLLRKYYVFKKK